MQALTGQQNNISSWGKPSEGLTVAVIGSESDIAFASGIIEGKHQAPKPTNLPALMPIDIYSPGGSPSNFSPGDGDRVELSGTGFATPVVSGLAASMLSANPKLSPSQLKTLLVAADAR